MNFNIRDIKTYKRFIFTFLLVVITMVVYSCNPFDDGSTSNTSFIPFTPPFSPVPVPVPGLQLTSISPTSGTYSGGTAVTITGTNFSVSGSTTVEIGGVPATSIVVSSDTSITAVTGGHVAGAVDVVVVGPKGSSNLAGGFTYVGPPLPALTSVSPGSGTTLGGTTVTLTGVNLTGTTAVKFDSVSATNISVVNDTTVTADTPAHAAGIVDVSVTTSYGSFNRTNAYTYFVFPTVTSVSPTTGATAGGTGFVLTGTQLGSITGVTFGGVSATSFAVVSSTVITGVTPTHAAGAVNVVAVGPGNPTLTGAYNYVVSSIAQPVTGGIIGCLNGGFGNFVIAKTDLSTGISWGGVGIATSSLDNSDGQSNAANNVAVIGTNSGTPYASKACDDYEVDSQGNTPCLTGNACYNDWFLPARTQMTCIYNNSSALGITSTDYFWTSTESDSGNAWIMSMINGAQFLLSKNTLVSIRCARAFTP